MNVYFLCRRSLFDLPGGDRIQIESTKRALGVLGVNAQVITDWPSVQAKLPQRSILHIFNPATIRHEDVINAKQHGHRIIVSPIHWDMKEYFHSMWKTNALYLRYHPRGYLGWYFYHQTYAGFVNTWWYAHSMRTMRRILAEAELLLPNSVAEADVLVRDFGIPRERMRIIVNGVDVQMGLLSAEPFIKKFGFHDAVLSVGRIEYRKNQHVLIQAMKNFGVPLVFIGKPRQRGYYSLCRTMASNQPNVHFIPHLPHDLVLSAMRASRVHALVSWYETPGLANIEAALAGTNLVVSERGSTKEYFGPYAEYCQPNDITSIKNAVERAYNKTYDPALRTLITNRYTWQEAGQQTFAAYESLHWSAGR